jgi:hypothetical protein
VENCIIWQVINSNVTSYSRYSKVTLFDLKFSLVASLAMLFGLTTFELFIHDTFVLPTYECNDPVMQNSEICKIINSKYEIRTPLLNYEILRRDFYWLALNSLIVAIPLLPAITRAKIGASSSAATLWYTTIILPSVSGFEDYLYFILKGAGMPPELPWLNNNVYLYIVNSIANGGTATPITSEVLLISTISSSAVIAVLWYLALRPVLPVKKRSSLT